MLSREDDDRALGACRKWGAAHGQPEAWPTPDSHQRTCLWGPPGLACPVACPVPRVLKGFLLCIFSVVSKFNTVNTYYVYIQENQ